MNDLDKALLVFNMVCDYFKLNPDIVRSRTRKSEYVKARFWFWWLCRKNFHGNELMNLSFLGSILKRDHAAVINGVREVDKFLSFDKSYVRIADELQLEFDKLIRHKQYMVDLAAGKYTDFMQNYFDGFFTSAKILEEHIKQDLTSEGWRRTQKLEIINKMKSNINALREYPKIREVIKQELLTDLRLEG